MKKEDIHFSDWKRILIGTAPWEFVLETFIRTSVIYLFLLIAMRMMGKRMSSQLSVLELSILIMLGAIVSVPMQVPERGILAAAFILLLVVLLHRGVNLLNFLSEKFEFMTQGRMSILIKDGLLDLQSLKSVTISREVLFSELRKQNVFHLGEIKRVYLEDNGIYSVYRNSPVVPGLSILPYSDLGIRRESKIVKGYFSCTSCGATDKSDARPDHPCAHCRSREWAEAVQ